MVHVIIVTLWIQESDDGMNDESMPLQSTEELWRIAQDLHLNVSQSQRDQIINVYNIIGSIGRLYLTSMAKLQQADFIQTLLRITSIHAAIECLIYKQHPLTISTFIKQLYAIAQSLMYIHNSV